MYGAKKINFEAKEVLSFEILKKAKIISEQEESKALTRLNEVEDWFKTKRKQYMIRIQL